MEPVTVQFFKHPDTPHWRHEMYRLGEDEHGTWLWAPAGSAVQRGEERAIRLHSPFLQLVPRRRHWSAIFNGPDALEYEIYIDVCTPPKWVGSERVEMIDLDLDVVRMADGEIRLLDEDEFLEHSVALSYPPPLVARTRTTAAGIVLALERRVEPFEAIWRSWWEAGIDT